MRLFMIFIALVIALAAGIAFWLVNSQSEPEPVVVTTPAEPSAPVVQEQTILIARQDIPVGKILDANDIDRQVWPQHLVIEDFIPDGNDGQVVDKVARTAFKKGQPLIASYLANKDDPGFLAAQLPEGMRAITIPVDAISGINGFIFPGDRVDVLVKHDIALDQDFKSSSDIKSSMSPDDVEPERATTVQRLPRESSYKVPLLMNKSKSDERPKMKVTEALVSNVRILAVGTLSTQYEGATATPTNVTLEVSELQAQKIRHADEGSLTLSLRSLEDADSTRHVRPIADADMTALTPPSYFPYLYGEGEYSTETLDLEEVDYGSEPSNKEVGGEKKNHIVIIRGVEKETVGVDR
jgi:Flp pilus assembly protein CpaB